MTPTGFGILTLVTFLPLLSALVLMLVPKESVTIHRYGALLATVATFGASLYAFSQFHGGSYHFQLLEYVPWIPSLGISYLVGVDGISIWLLLLTTFLSVISVWFSFYVNDRVKAYMIFLLILETAMLGVFVSLDMIVFYTFFEASLIPMYFLIAIWGGVRRSYASIKFFIYTFAGSIFMLIGMITLYRLYGQAVDGPGSFSLIDIQGAVANGTLWSNAVGLQAIVFWSFAIAFLVKCPVFPFHTWLPDAHVEAPTAGSIILAGVLLKMGTYGFLRFCLPLFPDVIRDQVPYIMGLAIIGIVYGAIVAAIQPDVKKLIAYSSVAHMGFILVGIFSLTHTGLMGGAVQQLNHGISTGALFLLVGLIYERRHTRLFTEFGGLKAQMPIYAALFMIIMLSSVGLPGTNGFVGEFLALMGGFEAAFAGQFGLSLPFAVIAAGGVILAAVYLLWMFQKVFYGPNSNPINQRLKDLKPWEIAMVGCLVVFVFWGGLFPNTFLKPMEASLGAARMMALNPESMRPAWNNLRQDMDAQGNLVQGQDRSQDDLATPLVAGKDGVEVLVPGSFHFPLKSPTEEVVAATTGAPTP
ncbi:MAG: NADH-quinone oxidoreductase subunit M [Fimbriimonadaceae bacterium]|nr:NADH-quinone oxidoreductase subunit M [Chthonomonadaceae bacterium]MCO5295584.1 NADH-quinone oxidoreductase subunit M [Fimbriimonadaceae bacterium]